MLRTRTLVVILSLILAQPAFAQVATPAPPKEYDVGIRYKIDAYRNEHVAQFNAMLKQLESHGFKPDEGPEDAAENRAVTKMTGVVPGPNARKLLGERHVRTLLLSPKGAMLPAEAEPVRVQIELTNGLPLERQRLLADQVRAVLATDLGFREAVGYDTRGQTRLVGMIPVKNLGALLEDLRRQPTAAKLAAPLENGPPVRVVEVQPSWGETKDRPAPPAVAKEQEKLTPELRSLVGNADEAGKTTRMEVILNRAPASDDRSWQEALTTAGDCVIEGRVGPLVTIRGAAAQAPAIAALPFVSTVRLPRSGEPRVTAVAGGKGDPRDALKHAGIDRVHALGRKGKGHRVVIIDGDFRGWKDEVGKGLPKKTSYLDLTAERNRSLVPEEPAGDPKEMGNGTRAALAAAMGAPEAELVLVRIDPESPHMLYELAKFLHGEGVKTVSLDQRLAEMAEDRDRVDAQRALLLRERKAILDNPGAEDEFKPRWAAYKEKEKALDLADQDLKERMIRYLDLSRGLAGLKDVSVVCCPIVWNEGHPVDGGSPITRYLDESPARSLLWFQTAGDVRGQAWAGLFRDADGNGLMEFSKPDAPKKAGRWSNEVNFLAWQPAGKPVEADLPAGTRFRLSIQWRESHDRELKKGPEDVYREPLINLRILLLRQIDPRGEKQAADDLEVVAQTTGLPQRLLNESNGAVYEQTLEVTIKDAGRYVIMVEGAVPTSTRPASEPTLPALMKSWDLKPRLFVQTLDGAGRVVFDDYATDTGSVGMPGDSRKATTIGALNSLGERQAYSGGGPPANLELLVKPDGLITDELGFDVTGTAQATGLASGMAASLLSAGLSPTRFLAIAQTQPGGVLRVPKGFSERTK